MVARSPYAYQVLMGEYIAANSLQAHTVPNPGVLDIDGDTAILDTAAKHLGVLQLLCLALI